MKSSSSPFSSSSTLSPPEEIILCGECCSEPMKGVTFKMCSGCRLVSYCSVACQTKAWSGHKKDCKLNRAAKNARDEAREKDEREKTNAKAKEKEEETAAARGSGSGSKGLEDMGSTMAAQMPRLPPPSPPPQRYNEVDVYNACFQGHHEELQKALRQGGIDVDWAESNNGITAAFAAAQEGHDKCLSQLILQGADLSKANKNGFAPVHIACQFGRYTCLELMADSRADLNQPVGDELGKTPAMICCQNGLVKCLALLSDKGADLNQLSNLGRIAAHIACQFGQLKCLQLLGKRGANLSIKDSRGYTSLDYARVYKQPDCVDLLLASGSTGMNVEDLPTASEANKNKVAEHIKVAKDTQREVRQCEYPACAVKAKDGAVLLKCPGCRVALYCCMAHAMQHMPEHKSFCRELTRICDYSKCNERADVDTTCRRCKVATYCSRKHREKHSSAHESRCEELRLWR